MSAKVLEILGMWSLAGAHKLHTPEKHNVFIYNKTHTYIQLFIGKQIGRYLFIYLFTFLMAFFMFHFYVSCLINSPKPVTAFAESRSRQACSRVRREGAELTCPQG